MLRNMRIQFRKAYVNYFIAKTLEDLIPVATAILELNKQIAYAIPNETAAYLRDDADRFRLDAGVCLNKARENNTTRLGKRYVEEAVNNLNAATRTIEVAKLLMAYDILDKPVYKKTEFHNGVFSNWG